MKEVYRKFGRVVRRENDLLVRVDEAGEAIEDSGTFACAPIDESRALPAVDGDAVDATADAIRRLKPERAIVSEGVAFHEIDGREWSERARRIHLSIARGPHRALIDVADFDLSLIARVAAAIDAARTMRDVRRLRLAPNVGAALLPSLIGAIPIQQWAAPHDGKGDWIANVAAAATTAPNWFRPSYRSRPRRVWFHLRADPFGEIDRDLPQAIALLGPIYDRQLDVLCLDGEDPFFATVTVGRIAAIAPSATWFPFAAGCYGAEMTIENDEG